MKNQTSIWKNLSYEVKRDKFLLVSFCIFITLVTMAYMAPLIAPHDPYDLASLNILNSEIPPSWEEDGDQRFLLGTDHQGRDLFSTILYGMRLSITISIFAVLIQVSLGIVLGLVAGYFGGWVDHLIMRLADIQLSLSTLMLAIISIAIVKAFFSIEVYEQIIVFILILVIGVSEWPQYARTIRAGVLEEKEKEYVEAAKCLGLSKWRIVVKHILPNILSPIFVISTIQVANAIISETSLSFLGLGVPPIQPSLGALIQNGFEYIFSGVWWITIIPSVFLILLILSINYIGDRLRDYFNPKLYQE